MEPFVKLLALFLLLTATQSVPVQQIFSREEIQNGFETTLDGNQCAQRCPKSDPLFIRYQSGHSYVYQFQTDTYLAEEETPISLEGALVLSALTPCSLALQLQRLRIRGVSEETALRMQQQLEALPIHFGYSDGHVTDVCVSPRDQQWTLNVKKALVSSLQMSSQSLSRESRVEENDLQGACLTLYQPISERYGKHVIKRTKNFAQCSGRQQWLTGLFPRAYNQLNEIPINSGQQECTQSIESDIIYGVSCEEKQNILLNRFQIKSTMNLRFEKQLNEIVVQSEERVRRHAHHLKMTNQEHNQTQQGQLEPQIRQLCQQMKNKDQKSVQEFSRLIRTLRRSPEEEIQRVYGQLQTICSSNQKQAEDLFLDACAHSGSSGAIKVIQKWSQKNRNSLRSQIVFRNLAFVSQPEVEALSHLVDILKSNSDQSEVLLGISAYFHNLKHSNNGHNSQEYREQENRIVEELIKKVNQKQEFQSIVAIKALQNIGLEQQSKARQQMTSLAANQQTTDGVRVAALKALSEALIGGEERSQVMSVFENERNANEIRLNAVKSLIMSGSTKPEMEKIKQVVDRTGNQNVKQYVRSLVENLKTTSDPHKKDIGRRLVSNGQQWNKADNKWFGISNNFETSFMLDAIGVGAVLESDVIYEQNSQTPSSVNINATLPFMGREVNLVEVEIRQKGLNELFVEKIQEVVREWKQKQSRQLVDSLMNIVQNWKHQSGEEVFVELNVKVDGKTIIVFNSKHNNNYQSIITALKSSELNAFAFQPINTRLNIPSANGWPIIARLNSTVVVSQVNQNRKFSPFLVWQTETGIQLKTGQQEKREVGVVFNVQSAPNWESIVDYSQNRFQMKVSIPEERISFLKTEAEVRLKGGSRGLWTGNSHQKCTEWTKKALGVELCFEKNQKSVEVFLKKSDRIQSYEFKMERNGNGNQIQIQFNTPGSQVDRHWEAEAEVNNQQSVIGLKGQLKSPWNRFQVTTEVRNDDKEQSLKAEVTKDGNQKQFQLDLALEQMSRGQKREFRPRVQITWQNQDLIKVLGTVSVAKGRKNQLMINLEGNQKQFLKGSLVREGDRKSADIRVSSDLSLHLLNGLEVKVNALFDKSPKHVNSDLQLEYRPQKSSRKESLKTSFKLQSLANSQQSTSAQKFSAFGELTSTQFPRLNCHVAYNLLNKPLEHLENELTVQWNEKLSQKVHVLQVTKVTGSEGKAETTVNLEISPLNVDYELRANGEQNSGQTSVEISGKDRKGNNNKHDFKASVQYKHVSRAPMHLTLNADLKTSFGEYKYSDDLKETNKDEYKGQTSVQWSQSGGQQELKMAKMDYQYKNQKNEHQMELQIQSPLTQKPIKHSALLRMSRHEQHVKSRLLIGDQLQHHVEALISAEGPNRVHVEGLGGYLVKGHAHPFELPQRASLEVMTPSQLIHRTDVEIVPRNNFRLKSDTKRDNRNIFALESEISSSKPSKLIFNSNQIEGKVDFRSLNGETSGQINVNHLLNDWTHSSSLRTIPQQKIIEVQSKTISKSQPLMVLDSIYNQKQKKINFLLPQKKTSVLLDSTSGLRNQRSAKLEVNCGQNFRHLSEYTHEEPEVHRFESVQSDFRSGSPLYHVQYKKSEDGHQLSGDYGQNYYLEGEVRPWNQFGDRQGSASWSVKNKNQQLEHNSKLIYDNKIVKIESQTRKSNQNLAEIEAQLHRLANQESHLKIKLPRAQTRAHLIVTPVSGAKIQYSAPNADHVTSLEWAGPHYACDSKTTLEDNHVTYQLAGNHSPNRKSFVSVKTPNYDVSGHVDRTWDTPSAKVSVISPKTSHMTEVSLNRNRKSIRIESRADRKSGPEVTENIYNFDGNYNHLNPEIASNFGLKIAKNLKINGKVQPFGQQKYISVSAEHPDFSHVTDLSLNGHLVVKSRTQNQKGINLAKIDSSIPFSNLKEKSFVTLVSPHLDTSLEIEPKIRSVQFQYRDPKWTHSSQLNGQSDYQLLSNTKLNGQTYFDLNGQLQHQIGGQSAKISFKTPKYSHQTNTVRTGNYVQLNSNTDYENQVLNKISFDSQKHLDLDIPHIFSAKTQWTRDGASVDYHSRMPQYGRHVLASIRMPRDQNQFGLDVAWDQQRDPNQRLKLDWETRDQQQGRVVHVLRAEYAGNELRAESDVQKRNVIYGPNTWSLKYTPKYQAERDTLEVIVQHVIKEEQMECHVQYLEGQKLKLDIKSVTKWQNENEIEIQFESQSPQNPDLNLKVDFKTSVVDFRSANAKIATQLKVRQNQKQYGVEWHVARQQQSSNDVIKGEISLETPSNGRQEMDFELTWNRKSVQFWAKSQERKLLELNARADIEHVEEKHVTVDLKSNIRDIPSVGISGDYFRSKQLSAKVEVDGQRKAEVSLIRTGSDLYTGSQVSLRVETSVWPKFESLLAIKRNSEEMDFEFNSKVDAKEVFSAVLKAKKSTSGVWTGKARVSDNGSQLAQLEAESTSGQSLDQFRYELKGNSRRNQFFGPMRVLFSVEKNRKSGNRVKVNACQESDNTCFDLNGLWKQQSSSDWIPERAEVALQKNGQSVEVKTSFGEHVEDHSSGQSVFGLTSGRVQQKLRNQMFVAINGHQMGFEATEVMRGSRGREHVLRMEFPNRKEMTLKSDYTQESGHWTAKQQLVDNSRQEVILETEVEATETEQDFRLRAEAKSEQFRGNNKQKKIEFWFQKPSQKVDFRSKLVIQVSRDSQPITIETYLERKPIQQQRQQKRQSSNGYFGQSNGQQNNTLVFQVLSAEKKIDFRFEGHVSPLTAGFLLENQNRRNQKKFSHLFIESEPSSGQEERFRAIYSTNQKRYRVEGAWLNNELHYQLMDEKNNRNDVRIALKGKCLELEVKNSGNNDRKLDLCLNYDQQNDQSLQVTIQELRESGQSRQMTANTELDTNGGQQQLKVDIIWTPELLREYSQEVKNWFQQSGSDSYWAEMIQELSEELIQKSSILYSSVIEDILQPVFGLLSDQIGDLFQEFQRMFGNFEKLFQFQRRLSQVISRQYQRLNDHVSQQFQSLSSLDTWFRPLTRVSRKQCQKYEMCYKLLYGLEKYGFEAIYDYFQWNSMRLLKESHRLVVMTSGRVLLSLPVPQWIQDYKQEVQEVFQSIIAQNPTLQSIVDTIEQLVREVSKDWEQIDGQEVKRSAKKLSSILFDLSAQRVVLFDPIRGRFSLEIKSNRLRRQLRSIQTKNNRFLSEFFV